MKKEGVVVFGDEEQPKRLEKIKALAAKLNTWLDISGSERLFDA
jgi:BRCT domain type II-containing protein